MYTLSIPSATIELEALVEVFHLFFHDGRFEAFETKDVRLTRNGATLDVTRYNGQFTVRRRGTASDIFFSMLEETYQAWFLRDGTCLQPWQVRSRHWEMLQAMYGLARKPQLMLSSDQLEAESVGAAKRGEAFSLPELVRSIALARFGFGAEGPRVSATGLVNGRHEVHVAYALLANQPVPDVVLEDYRAQEDPFRFDLKWADLLLDVPELRGAMSQSKLRHLALIMRREKKGITSETAAVFITVKQRLGNEPSPVDVDDVLFEQGLVDALPLPDSYQRPVDVGTPISPLAARLREIQSVAQRDRALERAETERAAGEISRRQYDLARQLTLLDHGRWNFEWSNSFATAVERRDVAMLLSILDTADDANRCSKQAVREIHGVKLRGVGPVARRRAIFALCGLDEAARAEWERQAAHRKADADRARDLRHAKEKAQLTRYRRADGVIVNGAEHVDLSIAEGFTEIRSYPKGASKVYVLAHPVRHEGRTVKAKDGTLAYARSVLDRHAA
jgi:hypothetical protein